MYAQYISLGNLFGSSLPATIDKLVEAEFAPLGLSKYTELQLPAELVETAKGYFVELNMYGNKIQPYIFVPKLLGVLLVTVGLKGENDIKVSNCFEIRKDRIGRDYFHCISPAYTSDFATWPKVFFDLVSWSGDKDFDPIMYLSLAHYEWVGKSKGGGAGVRVSVLPWDKRSTYTALSARSKYLDSLIIHD